MSKSKTRREWFKRLPLQVRLNAIENVRLESTIFFTLNQRIDYKHDNFKDSLFSAFDFSETKQGGNYWCNIAEKYNYEE